MKKIVMLISCVVLSWPALAQSDQSECKRQAVPAVDAIRFLSDTNMGLTEAQKQQAKNRLKKLDVLLEEGRYCEALQQATSNQ
ncbi:hypothetical protein [Vibrio sp. Hal054]|uniref:hypothetical protein n=1 Tax=Vibrio sp. Hal054 TaxID=3035158 RepID=UPI00301C37B8